MHLSIHIANVDMVENDAALLLVDIYVSKNRWV